MGRGEFPPCTITLNQMLQTMNHNFVNVKSVQKERNLTIFNFASFAGKNWLSVDRRHHDSTASGRLDPPLGASRRRLLPHERRPLDLVGRRHEGIRLGQQALNLVALTEQTCSRLLAVCFSGHPLEKAMLPMHVLVTLDFGEICCSGVRRVTA